MELPDGWLYESEAELLAELVRDVAEIKGEFLEIGSFQGRSSVAIGREVKKLNSHLYCIDIWNKEMKGRDEIERQKIRQEYRKMKASVIDKYFKGDMYRIFTENIKKWGLDNTVIPIIGFSSAIRKTWKLPLRFIFIDGNHDDEYVKEDCLWKQFLVKGGVMAFHDYRHRGGVQEPVDEIIYDDPDFVDIGVNRSTKAFRRI